MPNTSPFLFLSTMSQTSPKMTSRSNYQVIFDSALEAYKKKTGKDLTSNPLLCNIETCHSPDAILAVLRAQTRGLSRPQNDGDEPLTWLNPIINVVNSFSDTVGGGVGLVRLERSAVGICSLTLTFRGIPTCWGDMFGYRRPSLREYSH